MTLPSKLYHDEGHYTIADSDRIRCVNGYPWYIVHIISLAKTHLSTELTYLQGNCSTCHSSEQPLVAIVIQIHLESIMLLPFEACVLHDVPHNILSSRMNIVRYWLPSK